MIIYRNFLRLCEATGQKHLWSKAYFATGIPLSLPSFKRFNLLPNIEKLLSEKEMHTPTPIQDLAIPEILKGRFKLLYIAAQTGTGKTLSFILPTLNKLKESEVRSQQILTKPNRPRMIILVPSKELVFQMKDVLSDFVHNLKLKIHTMSNTDSIVKQKRILDEGIDVLVTTVDRLEKLRERRCLFFTNLEYMIIDEADTFVDSGYKEVLMEYMKLSADLRKEGDSGKVGTSVLLVGATLTTPLRKMFRDLLGEKEETVLKKIIEKHTHMNLSNLNHEFIHIQTLDKQEPCVKILKEYKSKVEKVKGATMIFCNSVPSCQSLDYKLKSSGFNCVTLHSNMPKQLRLQSYEQFKSRQVDILISTDLGSRGLDFTFLAHVINFDFPPSTSDYLHRAGRAGRAGRKGYVTSFYHEKDKKIIDELKASHETNSPLPIGTSSYSLINREILKNSKGENIRQSDLLPPTYIDFRKNWEASQEVEKTEKRKIKNFIPPKNEKLREIKALIKEKKTLKGAKLSRSYKQRSLKALSLKMRGVRRKISREDDKENRGANRVQGNKAQRNSGNNRNNRNQRK